MRDSVGNRAQPVTEPKSGQPGQVPPPGAKPEATPAKTASEPTLADLADELRAKAASEEPSPVGNRGVGNRA
jgi:hypothetical protein